MHIDFFGTKITVICQCEQLNQIEELIKKNCCSYITYSNVHVVVTAANDKFLMEAVNYAAIASPDGTPLVWAARLKGVSAIERCSGPDMMEKILKMSVEKGYRHYFYGGTSDNLEKLRQVIIQKYPGIKIAGMDSPPFRVLTTEEDQATIDNINRESPDLIWVGLGAPKQELWMYEHQAKINHGIMLGVGAAFDFLTGKVRRAPEWARKIGLEWFCRLIAEPGRLWKRYLITNSRFIYLIVTRFLFKKRQLVLCQDRIFRISNDKVLK
jgi:N-acetylglucosaminyldiphosphoundecaprenol N-acetyl-beta-D-mannosaminyltransferase